MGIKLSLEVHGDTEPRKISINPARKHGDLETVVGGSWDLGWSFSATLNHGKADIFPPKNSSSSTPYRPEPETGFPPDPPDSCGDFRNV